MAQWRHMMTLSASSALYEENPPVTSGVPSQRASNGEVWYFLLIPWTNSRTNNRIVGDLRCHDAHVSSLRWTVPWLHIWPRLKVAMRHWAKPEIIVAVTIFYSIENHDNVLATWKNPIAIMNMQQRLLIMSVTCVWLKYYVTTHLLSGQSTISCQYLTSLYIGD